MGIGHGVQYIIIMTGLLGKKHSGLELQYIYN